MPIYKVQAPNGKIYKVEGPEGATEDQLFGFVSGQIGFQPAEVKPQEGISAALTGGFKRFLSTGQTALGSLGDPEEAARRGLERSQQIGEQYAPGASLEKVKQAYEQRGLLSAAGEAISQIPSALAEQAPQIAATLGSAKLGAMAGSPFGPVGAIVGGVAGAAVPSLTQLYGSNIERQAQEGAPEISRSAALAAAAPGAALEVASTFIPLGRNLIGKLLGPNAAQALARGSNEAIERQAQESLTKTLLKGTGVGVLAEIPTEVTQQMLERLQAGLPLTTEDALKEYGEAAYGAGLVGGPFGAGARALGRPAARAELDRIQQEEAARLAVSEEELAERFPDVLPGGFKIEREELGREMAPQGYSIMAEGREEPLSVVDTQEEADAKLASLTNIRAQERENLLKEEERINSDIQKAREKLERLEATEQTDTDEYRSLKAELPTMMDESAQKIKDAYDRVETLSKPLTIAPFGEIERVNEQFKLTGPDNQPVGVFKTREQAEGAVEQAVGEETFKQTKQSREAARELYKTFVPQMRKFGLGDVGLNIVDKIENGAGGAYLNKLIRVSLEDANPVQTMRHESLHALKDLGFFTPQQWKALEERANKQWIKEFLEGQETEIDGQKMSRLEGYRKLGYSQEAIVEEAIADAFGSYDKGAKPPPGMIAALARKIKNFFANLAQALRGAGFQSADDIFQNIERGRLKPAKVEAKAEPEEKLSVRKTQDEETIESGKRYQSAIEKFSSELKQKMEKANQAEKELALIEGRGKSGEMISGKELRPYQIKAGRTMSAFEKALKENNIEERASGIIGFVNRSGRYYNFDELTGKEKLSLAKPSAANAWQADAATIKAADKFEEDTGIRPYVSEGFLDLPIQAPKYSLQKFNPEKHLKFDPTLGVPINKDGTVTVYYHTTKQSSLDIGRNKVIPSEGRNRVYLTNESGGDAVLRNRGSFDQELDGSTVLVYVTPDMLQLDAEYENGRRDFFIPLAQGDFFNKKMKMQSIQKGRQEAITGEFSYDDHEKRITKAVNDYKAATPAERKKMVAAARKLLKKEHNVGNLLSENGKLEKTRIGEYGLDYEGNSVASQGLGLAAAQKISDKVSTCPRSAICEGLCLGETSGGNFMFGGTASEDVDDIAKSAFRAGPRMMQYLKTEALIINPEAFTTLLQAEIDSLKKWSASPTQTKINKETKKREQVAKEIYQPAVRLNVTSDFKPEMFRAVIESNPDVQFYDYTKLGSESIGPNHHLTYSSTGFGQIVNGEAVFFKNKAGQYDHNWATMRGRLNNGQNVAMAFSSKSALPKVLLDEETGVLYRVWDGDDYDARFLDPKQSNGLGMIIGLRNKAGNLSEKNATQKTGGFFVQYDPKKDGDKVVVPNQAQFKGRKVIPVAKAEKFSLKAPTTPAFKLWFGDSKVVNKDGSPKIMYHGTSRDITEFRPKQAGAIFLTDDPDVAESYSQESAQWMADHADEFLTPDQKKEVLKRTKKLMRDNGYRAAQISALEADQGILKTDEFREAVAAYMPSGPNVLPLFVRAEKIFDFDNPKHVKSVVEQVPDLNPDDFQRSNNWTTVEDPKVQAVIRAMGFDSFYVNEHGIKNLAVYEPNQVKSASGNAGTYDRNSPEIRYSLRGVAFPTVKEAQEAADETPVPSTEAFKQYIAGSQWLDDDGKAKKFYHATTSDFFQFNDGVIYLSDTAEESDKWGKVAEDRLRERIYKALNKDEKLPFFQQAVDEAVAAGKITEAKGAEFMRDIKRKVPEFGNYDMIKKEMDDILLSLSPNRMKVMPLYARAMMPFDFRNKEHVKQVMENYDYTEEMDRKVGDLTRQVNKQIGGAPTINVENILDGLKGILAQGYPKVIERPDIIRTIRKLGFDGYVVRRNRTAPLSYAVFKPQQVKSITGNDGQFALETKDIRYSLKSVRYTPQRFEQLFDESMYLRSGEENKTKGYLAFVDPMNFVRATATTDDLARLREEQEPLDIGKMAKLATVPQLNISIQNGEWKIVGHEGRHRMLSMHDMGYKNAPVFIKFATAIDDAKPIPVKVIKSQFKDSLNPIVMVAEAEPLSYANKDKAMEKFTDLNSEVKYSLPRLSDAANARIREVAPGRIELGFKDQVIGLFKQDFTGLRQKFLNRYETLAVLDRRLREMIRRMGGPELLADQSAEFAALQSDQAAGVAASAIGVGDRQGGVPVYRNGFTTIDTSVKGLAEALAPLAKYGKPAKAGEPDIYSQYQFWAGWKRARRLLREGREELYNAADARIAQEIENAHPEFIEVQKDLIAFNNGIVNYAVQTGVLSRERARVYTQYADYIPFYRQLELDKTIDPNPFSGISGQRGPKEIKGGTGVLGDFLENMVRNTQSMINAGMKNAAAQKATKVALELNEVERLPGPAKGIGVDVYTVLENGNLVYYRANDKLFIDALASLNMPDLPFLGILSAPANVLRNLVTKDPGFMLANLLRDSLSSYVTSGQNVTPIVGTMVNFGKALSSKNKNLQALFNAGVIGGYEFSQNIQQSGKTLNADLNKKAGKDPIVLRPFKSLWEGLEKGTTASDAATRMAVYERVLNETGNEAEAISRAMEVMNFNRKGNSVLIRIATAALPFFNARLQGLDLFYRASTGQMNTKDAQEIKRRFWIRGTTMMALSAMYYLSVADDEEYERQEEETKDNNWIIPSLGIRIPIPFEVGTLFKTMPERILAYAMGNDTGKDLRDSTLRALANTFAFNPIPQTFKPIIEVATNYNFFTMRPIVGQGMQDVAPQFQVGPGTSKTAETIGGLINVSPMKLDHLIKGYTGTMGGYAVDVVDAITNEFSDIPKASKRFEQLPVVKRFALDPEARGSVTQFYELQKSVDTFVRTANLLEKTARPEEYVKYVQENIGLLAAKDYISSIEKEMTKIRDTKKIINTSDMPSDEKRDLLVDLGRLENNLTANIKSAKRAFSELK